MGRRGRDKAGRASLSAKALALDLTYWVELSWGEAQSHPITGQCGGHGEGSPVGRGFGAGRDELGP